MTTALPACGCGRRFENERQWRQHVYGPTPPWCRTVYEWYLRQRREALETERAAKHVSYLELLEQIQGEMT